MTWMTVSEINSIMVNPKLFWKAFMKDYLEDVEKFKRTAKEFDKSRKKRK